MKKQSYSIEILVGTGILLLLSVPFWFTNLDFSILNHFYNSEAAYPWTLRSKYLWSLIYKFGSWPAMMIAIGALYVFLVGYWKPDFAQYRRKAVYIVLVMVVGPGLLVNAILKDNYGRPRPRQVQKYGGTHEYYRVCQPAFNEKGKSFPCGHCSMGFFFFALYFLYKRKNQWKAWAGMLIGIVYGLLLGIARVGQGGHFPSDVLWAGGLTYLTAAVLAKFLQPEKEPAQMVSANNLSTSVKAGLLTATIVLGSIMILAILLASPVDISQKTEVRAADGQVVHLNFQQMDGVISHTNDQQLNLTIRTEGFGFPGNRAEILREESKDTILFSYRVHGFRTESKNTMSLAVPQCLSGLYLRIQDGHIYFKDSITISNVKLEFYRGSLRFNARPGKPLEKVEIFPHGNKVFLSNSHLWRVSGKNLKRFEEGNWQKFDQTSAIKGRVILTAAKLVLSPVNSAGVN